MTARLLLSCLLLICCASGDALAETIVDTGGVDPTSLDQWILRRDQWLAGEFTIAAATTITAVEGYIRTNPTQSLGGTFTISLYADGGEVPSSGDPLYFAAATRAAGKVDPAWEGLSGLDWSLDSGSYWVTFEIRPTDTLADGIMPVPSAAPLLDEAYAYRRAWSEYDELDIGVRISGQPVPEPGAAWLSGSALVCLLAIRRVRRMRSKSRAESS